MKKDIYTILNREGTTQSERYPEALSPEYAKIDERSLVDLVKQSAEYAKYVKYYSENNTVNGDWTGLFNEIYDYENKKVKFNSIEELEEKASVSPHIALFLSFLRLFGIAQDNLNSLKEKHLDFYFKEILGIEPKAASPDHVTLFFEPNKSVRHALVESGTFFEAGKDALGKPLLYTTKNDLVVNHAKIEAVKGIYRNSDGIYYIADDMLNHCINDDTIKDHFLGVHCEKNATIGVAIASPLFDLPDGERIITLEATLNIDIDKDNLKTDYTTEKGWEEVACAVKETQIIITIKGNQPALTVYRQKVHNERFKTDYPVIRILLNNTDEILEKSNNIIISKIQVAVKKSKAIILSNRYGLIDINNPFMPFGSQPDKNEKMKIFNPSIFNEYLKSFSLNTKWNNEPECKYPKLERGHENTNIDFTYLELDEDLEHSSYAKRFAEAALYIANPDINPNSDKKISIPDKPLTPEITNFSINYEIDSNFSSNAEQLHLFHIHPNGWEKEKSKTLFPLIIDGEGALFLGINGLNEQGILSIYLHLSDYGVNFEKVIDEKNTPVWHYLEGNSWKEFAKEDIVLDSTENFSQSGMVYFNINSGAFVEHTAMPGNMIWLMLLFKENSDAFPILNKVETQAVDAILVDNGNDLSHLEKGIPAGTISKPKTVIRGIRTVKQLYPSSGGRAPEPPKTYYTRVSEQLRHKNRAWNIWDYERIILENFPAVYKVKCIPHFNAKTGYAPGNIQIILLPDCNKIPQIDILRPIVNQALINETRELLKTLCSPFVSLNISNPVYEQITVNCEIEFMKGYDESFYRDKLNEDLKQFLSPWINTLTDIDFCKTLTNAQIIYFIEKQPYINHLKSISVNICSPGSNENRIIKDIETIRASKQNAVLTSADKHNIL
jgi:Baseplate J-like protein.